MTQAVKEWRKLVKKRKPTENHCKKCVFHSFIFFVCTIFFTQWKRHIDDEQINSHRNLYACSNVLGFGVNRPFLISLQVSKTMRLGAVRGAIKIDIVSDNWRQLEVL